MSIRMVLLLVAGSWLQTAMAILLLGQAPELGEHESGEPSAVVYIGKGRGWALTGRRSLPAGGRPVSRGLIAREIGRQALVIAAAEELRLAIQDGWLTTTEPPVSALRLDLVASGGQDSLVELLVGAEPIQEVVWKQVLDVGKPAEPLDYARLVAVMEELSRTRLVALVRERLAGRLDKGTGVKLEPSAPPPSELPADIERLLARLDVGSQFAVLHRLHAMTAEGAPSPALVDGLVRGYANLGLLTELQWNPLHAVFKARALLYAQRLVVQHPKSALAFHDRAYAFALAGFHALALADHQRALDLGGERPGWAEVVAARCRYETRRLAAIDSSHSEFELAQLLHYVCIEDSLDPDRFLPAAKRALEALPGCRRIADGPATFRRIGMLEVPDEPLNIEEKADLLAIVRQVKREPDHALPNSVLARLVMEETFMDCLAMAEQPNLGAAAKVRAGKALAKHPYLPFLLRTAGDDRRELLVQLSKAIDREALEMKEKPLWMAVNDVQHDLLDGCFSSAFSHQDEAVGDVLRVAGWGHEFEPYARRILALSPYSPFARARIIADPESNLPLDAHKLEEESADQPEVLLALGNRYLQGGKLADAERCLSAAERLEPGWKTQSALAEVYHRQQRYDLWIAALQSVAGDREHGGEVPTMIAEHYVARRQWASARCWSDAAGERGTSQGMLVAATVCEAFQDWPAAEHWYQQLAQTDAYRAYVWFFFCRRVGQGDLQQAQQLARGYMKDRETRTGRFADWHPDLLTQAIAGAYYLLDHYPDKARICMQEEFLRSHGVGAGLYAALIADMQGDTASRDAVLADIATKMPADQRKLHPQLLMLAKLLAADLTRGAKAEFDWPELEKLRKEAQEPSRGRFCYFLGVYLDRHGQREKAIEYFKHAMLCLPLDSSHRTLAGDALQNHSVFPEVYKAELAVPMAGEGTRP